MNDIEAYDAALAENTAESWRAFAERLYTKKQRKAANKRALPRTWPCPVVRTMFGDGTVVEMSVYERPTKFWKVAESCAKHTWRGRQWTRQRKRSKDALVMIQAEAALTPPPIVECQIVAYAKALPEGKREWPGAADRDAA
tara:strand:- start:46 stop:468 length:423 start_codon:yes stop_codon:yes gene_type:complete